ncbi:condensation domain-containing protein, partial [Streptomyces sp. NPDC048191]|uniref:condensation domain-containing protein n=1 Tax=Streptomyces sp. NPDC048191 TaxID=3155484 RepID=UPI0033F3779E
MHGGRVVVVPREVAQSPDEFLDLLVRERVSVLSQTPSAFRSLVGAAADGDPRVGELGLRAVIFAGEKLEVGDLQPWVSRLGLGRTALVNMYGITETTVHSTYHRLTKRDFAEGAGNPIGRPLSDLSIHLLDSYGNLVPVGVPGEMYVGGPGVARGYLGRPALTAERFVPDPFGPAGSRLYRSGDLARRREDGSLEFLGRMDDQVKIRGYRIELGEIETALSGQVGIRDAVVIVREDTPGDKRLVAYYVPAPGATVDLSAVRSELGLSLPEYMVPAAFVELEALPLTPNGKLDKRALPAPEQDAFARGTYVAPRDETEARIAAVWSEVLGLDAVSVEDSFFDLGGDSIRAVSLVGALRVAGIDTTMQEVFAARTVAAMAAHAADGRSTSAAHQDTVAVRPFALITDEDRGKVPAAVVDAYPLTQAQTGMVIEMLAKGGARSYHNVASLRVRGEEFSPDALRAALGVVAERHDVLRTTIDLETYSVPMQLVHAAAEIPLTVEDLTGLAASEAEQALRDFVTAESEAVFDLGRAPLMRVAVHLCADGSWQFTLTEAHAIIDGWSYHSLLAELVGCFRQLRDEREPDAWTPPAVRFADAVAGELASLRGTEDRAYWRRIVDDYAKFQLPAGWADAPDTPREQYEIEVGYADLEDSLRALAAASGASVKSVVHAAHQKVVSMLTDEPVFHTGLTCHIRPEVMGSERAHGMYLNVLPFAADREARTWRELVQRVFARETELWEHRMFPMPTIQRELADGERLIDVHFSYQDFRVAEQGAAGDDGQGTVDVASSMGASSNEFSLFVVAGPNRLNVITHTHAVGRAHGERVARMFRAVLEAMAENPDATIDAASLLPAGELHRLLIEWNAGAVPFEDGVSLHELVERQAVVVPDAPAVVGVDGCLSFAELDARA